MNEKMPQTYENHARLIPVYHMVCFGILGVNALWALWGLVGSFSFGSLVNLAVAAALLILFFFIRIFALTAQDRIIRLEMRLRLGELLPADLKARIGELALGQLIALRFASDEELPALTRKVLDEKILERDAIKRLIKTWNPDYLRV